MNGSAQVTVVSSSLGHLEQPIMYYTSLGRHRGEKGTHLSAVAAFFTPTSLDGGVDPDALEEPRNLALGIRQHSAKDDITIIEEAS